MDCIYKYYFPSLGIIPMRSYVELACLSLAPLAVTFYPLRK